MNHISAVDKPIEEMTSEELAAHWNGLNGEEIREFLYSSECKCSRAVQSLLFSLLYRADIWRQKHETLGS